MNVCLLWLYIHICMIYFNAYLMNRKNEEKSYNFWWIHILILCARIAFDNGKLILEKRRKTCLLSTAAGGVDIGLVGKTSVLNNWKCERNRNYYCLLLHSTSEGEMCGMKSYFIPQGTLWRTYIIKGGGSTHENIMHGNEKPGEKEKRACQQWDGMQRRTWCLV